MLQVLPEEPQPANLRIFVLVNSPGGNEIPKSTSSGSITSEAHTLQHWIDQASQSGIESCLGETVDDANGSAKGCTEGFVQQSTG